MKNLQTFNEFLNESNMINEASVNLGSISKRIQDIVSKAGYKSTEYRGSISIDLEGEVHELDPKLISVINQVKKMDSDGNILVIKTAIGYTGGNSISFKLPHEVKKARKAFHITSKSVADTILSVGMVPQSAKDHSDTFGSGVTGKSLTEQTYKANFAVSTKGGIKKLHNFFNFGNDYVVLEINAKPYTWYVDPLLPEEVSSILTYDTIKAEDIKIHE